MSPERENKIVNKYPEYFPDFRGDPTKTCLAWGLDINDGWADLFESLCENINSLKPSDFCFIQVKEKFGGLRAYHSGGDERISKLIMIAEEESYRICERCGSRNQVGTRGRGWIVTLCDNCRYEENS